MLRVTFDENRALAHWGPCRLKLLEEPAKRYLKGAACCGLFNPVLGQVFNPLNDKLIFRVREKEAVGAPKQLSALFFLDQTAHHGGQTRVSGEPLTGCDLFNTMLACNMDTQHHAPARLERQFHFTERLIRTISIFRLTYPRTYDVMDSVADQVYRAIWE